MRSWWLPEIASSVSAFPAMSDEPVWGHFRRLARENGLYDIASITALADQGKLWPSKCYSNWRVQMTGLMRSTRDMADVVSYFQTNFLYPQLVPQAHWRPRRHELMAHWFVHHAVFYPSPLVIRSCSECTAEDVRQLGFSWFRLGHQLPGIEWCPRHSQSLHQLPTGRELSRNSHLIQSQPPLSAVTCVQIPLFVQRYLYALEWLRGLANREKWGSFELAVVCASDGEAGDSAKHSALLKRVKTLAPTGWYRKNFVTPRPLRNVKALDHPVTARSAWLSLCAAAVTTSIREVEELIVEADIKHDLGRASASNH